MAPHRTVILGDIYWDVVAGQLESLPPWGGDRVVNSIVNSLGGSAANTARHLASLQRDNPEHEVYLLSAVGQDATGSAVLQQLRDDGVRSWWRSDDAGDGTAPPLPAAVVSGSTGSCIVLSGKEDRAFVSCNGANDVFDPLAHPSAVAALDDADHIHVHGYFNCVALQRHGFYEYLRGLKARRGTADGGRPLTISLDTQYDAAETWTRENLKDLLTIADVFFPNETEAAGVGRGLLKVDDAAMDTHEKTHALLARAFPSTEIVMTIGAGGCLGSAPATAHPPTRAVPKVVDTTGAGDAFTAAYLMEWITAGRGAHDIARFARTANTAAGIVVQRNGACDPPLAPADLA